MTDKPAEQAEAVQSRLNGDSQFVADARRRVIRQRAAYPGAESTAEEYWLAELDACRAELARQAIPVCTEPLGPVSPSPKVSQTESAPVSAEKCSICGHEAHPGGQCKTLMMWDRPGGVPGNGYCQCGAPKVEQVMTTYPPALVSRCKDCGEYLNSWHVAPQYLQLNRQEPCSPWRQAVERCDCGHPAQQTAQEPGRPLWKDPDHYDGEPAPAPVSADAGEGGFSDREREIFRLGSRAAIMSWPWTDEKIDDAMRAAGLVPQERIADALAKKEEALKCN